MHEPPRGYYTKEFALTLGDVKRDVPWDMRAVHNQLYDTDQSWYYGLISAGILTDFQLGDTDSLNALANNACFTGVDCLNGMAAYLMKHLRSQTFPKPHPENRNGFGRHSRRKGTDRISYQQYKPHRPSPLRGERFCNDLIPAITDEEVMASFNRRIAPTYFRDRPFGYRRSDAFMQVKRSCVDKAARRQGALLKKRAWGHCVKKWNDELEILRNDFEIPPPPLLDFDEELAAAESLIVAASSVVDDADNQKSIDWAKAGENEDETFQKVLKEFSENY